MTAGGRRGRRTRPGLQLLRGTPRTLPGWGSADSATPGAPCLSTFQSPGKTGGVGRGAVWGDGRLGGKPKGPCLVRRRMEGARREGVVPRTDELGCGPETGGGVGKGSERGGEQEAVGDGESGLGEGRRGRRRRNKG